LLTDHRSGALGRDGRVDFAAILATQPTAYLVMSPDLVIIEANQAFSELVGRSREELIGQYVFDTFPTSPDALDEAGGNSLHASFERAGDTGLPDQMPLSTTTCSTRRPGSWHTAHGR
jgi:PAS domain-containing protein